MVGDPQKAAAVQRATAAAAARVAAARAAARAAAANETRSPLALKSGRALGTSRIAAHKKTVVPAARAAARVPAGTANETRSPLSPLSPLALQPGDALDPSTLNTSRTSACAQKNDLPATYVDVMRPAAVSDVEECETIQAHCMSGCPVQGAPLDAPPSDMADALPLENSRGSATESDWQGLGEVLRKNEGAEACEDPVQSGKSFPSITTTVSRGSQELSADNVAADNQHSPTSVGSKWRDAFQSTWGAARTAVAQALPGLQQASKAACETVSVVHEAACETVRALRDVAPRIISHMSRERAGYNGF